MKRNKCLLMILLSGMIALLIFPNAVFAEKTIKIKAATHYPIKHRLTTDAFLWFTEEVEKRTDNQVDFKWYLGGTLVKPPQTHDALKNGLVDLTIVTAGDFEHLYPVTNGIQMPFTFDSPVHAADVLWEMYQTMPEMQQEYKNYNIKVLGFFGTGMMNIPFKDKLPKTLEDMKGLRIGTFTGTLQKITKSLGATPQMITVPDLYLALQRGMVDGVVFPLAPARSWRIVDQASNYLMVNAWTGPLVIGMSQKKWDQLPANVQKVINDLSPSVGFLSAYTLENETKWVEDELKKRGDTFYYLPPAEKKRWIEKTRNIQDAWIEKLNSKGMNGQSIYNRMMKIVEEKRDNPTLPDAWWGRAGKKEGDGFISPASVQ